MWFIGDIHGDFDWYLKKGIKKADCSIQLGDFGWGFAAYSSSMDLQRIPEMPQHKFICGNHDNRTFAAQHPNNLGDYGYIEKADMFYISGGYSIDYMIRTIGIDWWANEQLSWDELSDMIDLFILSQPRYVVSHDAPSTVLDLMYQTSISRNGFRSRTQEAMMQAFEGWKPEWWLFGHHHETKSLSFEGTNFRCVGTHQRYEIPRLTWEKTP